jgi:hypothetical protein
VCEQLIIGSGTKIKLLNSSTNSNKEHVRSEIGKFSFVMEKVAENFSETLVVIYQTSRRHVPEDSDLRSHRI